MTATWTNCKKTGVSHVSDTLDVMTTLSKVSDFVYFLPFLFSLYHYPEPSRTFYNDPHTTAMMYIPDHSSMT